MEPHTVFYYPYSYFADDESPILKLAALYFDKIYILDPKLAHHDGVGITDELKTNLHHLAEVGILELVKPSEVFQAKYQSSADYEEIITRGIQADLDDHEFRQLCQRSQKQRWNISLAKIPKPLRDIPQLGDNDMRQLLSGGDYIETHHRGTTYDEYRETPEGEIEYRVADFVNVDIEFGEAVMMNHTLVSGLLYKGATPITDDPFHNDVFQLKIKRAMNNPLVREVLEDHYNRDHINESLLVDQMVKDRNLELATIPSIYSIEDILKYRFEHENDLKECRNALGLMARQIQEKPWSQNLEDEIYRNIIPNKVKPALDQARRDRKDWMERKGLDPAIPATIGAVISLVVQPTPLLPISLILAGASALLTIKKWFSRKKPPVGNGLHYFVELQSKLDYTRSS